MSATEESRPGRPQLWRFAALFSVNAAEDETVARASERTGVKRSSGRAIDEQTRTGGSTDRWESGKSGEMDVSVRIDREQLYSPASWPRMVGETTQAVAVASDEEKSMCEYAYALLLAWVMMPHRSSALT